MRVPTTRQAAVGGARQIERHEVQKDAARGTYPVARAQKPGMAEDERRRQQTGSQQGLRAVDVGGHGVQQPRPLPQAAFELLPLWRLDDQRQDVEAPGTLNAVGGRVDVVGDAVLVDLTDDALLRLSQILGGQLGGSGKFRPGRAQRAVARARFVEVPGGHDILRLQRRTRHGSVRRSSV